MLYIHTLKPISEGIQNLSQTKKNDYVKESLSLFLFLSLSLSLSLSMCV
jgi:hypothetical protein